MKTLDGGLDNIKGLKTAGLKEGKFGLALLVFDKVCNAQGVFTTNKICAAPVKLTKETLDKGIRAVVANSGNANCSTGEQGMRDAKSMAWRVAELLNFSADNVAVASTGIIGKYLDTSLVKGQIGEAVSKLGDKSLEAAKAIMTTDTKAKELCLEFDGFKIAGIAKGAGMIHPNMATMLCFIATDAVMPKGCLKRAVDNTFNMMGIDNDMSTNDTVLLVSTSEQKTGEKKFESALDIFCKEMAGMLIADGEGVTTLVEVEVTGANTKKDARLVARAIADSYLVKTSVFGNNPNWGRVAAAAGYCGAEMDEKKLRIWYDVAGEKTLLFAGSAETFDKVGLGEEIKKVEKIRIIVDLGLGKESALAWSGDLSFDYVKINAEYN